MIIDKHKLYAVFTDKEMIGFPCLCFGIRIAYEGDKKFYKLRINFDGRRSAFIQVIKVVNEDIDTLAVKTKRRGVVRIKKLTKQNYERVATSVFPVFKSYSDFIERYAKD